MADRLEAEAGEYQTRFEINAILMPAKGLFQSWLIRKVTRRTAFALHTGAESLGDLHVRGFLTRDGTSTSSTLSCG